MFKKLSLSFLFAVYVQFSFAQLNITLQSHLAFPTKKLSNIGGFKDASNNEYALVGTSTGLSIVDVTNPTSPTIRQNVPGDVSDWREVKTWGNYAYVTTEGGGGLCIIDLSVLPTFPATYKFWEPTVLGDQLNTIHALHIENGFAYLYGSNIGEGGIVIADLTDPWNPTVAGVYDTRYVHDGYVRNDTVYACHIFDGFFSIIDVINKATPVEHAQQETPNKFSHNSWLSESSQYLFTTDEVDNTYLTAYDVSDITNIREVDRIQSQHPGEQAIVHNTHIVKKVGREYAVTSWYKDGVVITDVTRPQNLVNVGYIDENPLSGGGFDGIWGVYPYLPSGNLVCSDINEGLYVYAPTYVPACYLEGNITDNVCGTGVNRVKIEINAIALVDSTNFNGEFKTGTTLPGTYSVSISKPGYVTQVITNVVLTATQVTTLNIQLVASGTIAFAGNIEDNDGNKVAGVPVIISSANNDYSFTSNSNGDFSKCGFVGDNYSVQATKWGYDMLCLTSYTINSTAPTHNFTLAKKYKDDFTFNLGWTTSATASAGFWTRAIPNGTFDGGTPSNPGNDVGNDCSNMAFVTGNTNSTSIGEDDVDNGNVTLTSPIFDVSQYGEAEVYYSRWFYNCCGNGGPFNDSLAVKINNGTETVTLERVTESDLELATWADKSFILKDYITITPTMKLIITAYDATPGHIVEAGFDNFFINDNHPELASIKKENKNNSLIYPNPSAQNFTLQAVEKTLVQIVDVQGRVKEEFTINANEQKTFGSNYAKGIYFVKTISANNINTQKVVKQ
ncbi:MAG: choice-of-anchor B family protein [Bacteroidota bacterium]